MSPAESGGIPARIVGLAQARPAPGDERPPAPPGRAGDDPETRRVYLTLSLLREPVSVRELAQILELPRARIVRALGKLTASRLACEDDTTRPANWVFTGAVGEAGASVSDRELRRAHRAIARAFLGRSRGDDDPIRLEAVHHLWQSGAKGEFVRRALSLIGYLKGTYQNRTALGLLRELRAVLSPHQKVVRLRAELEAAELHSRVGNLGEGIDRLREFIPQLRDFPPVWRKRLQLRLATLYSRRGDYREAEGLFREGLRAEQAGRRHPLPRRELLVYTTELAAMLTMAGEYDQARRLCDEGLKRAASSRDDEATREAILNFRATRGHIEMRHFHFEEAIEDFEAALELADAIASLTNRAVLLNNLGIVYAQSDRSRRAIRLFEEAEKTCRQLDEGPSLSFVYGNLALLYAKAGELEKMDEALERADKLSPAATGAGQTGTREAFYLEHHRGLALLCRGRYHEARIALERKLEIGARMNESFISFFGRVYRAEALLMEGEYLEAGKQLSTLADDEDTPPRVRRMARARLAAWAAWMGCPEDVECAVARRDALCPERPIPYLEAWDELFIGWAFHLIDRGEAAAERLRRAEDYFEAQGLIPAAALIAWIRAERALLEGDSGALRAYLDKSGDVAASSDLLGVLRPLLAARTLLGECSDASEAARAADLLTDADHALARNPLGEWSLRLEALRSARAGDPADREADRRALVAGFSPPEQERFLNARSWRVWTQIELEAPDTENRNGGAPARRDQTTVARTIGETAGGRVGARADLVANSSGMRQLAGALDRLRDTELPILIEGETGTGKEMVARIVHAESRRARRPFRVLDCSTVPAGLWEVELFGARAGAFTGATEDRPGLLTHADGGTILIDHLVEIPAVVQAKLLRVLSTGCFRPLGAEIDESCDVRFLYSITGRLDSELVRKRLRPDLYQRLKAATLRVPPLRERLEDFPDLIELLLKDTLGHAPPCEGEVVERMRGWQWPGNVRQLRSFVARLALESSRLITVDEVDKVRESSGESALAPFLIRDDLLAKESLSDLRRRLEGEYLITSAASTVTSKR